MIQIFYNQMIIFISIIWVIVRAICNIKNKRFDIKREAVLLLVYICIVVVSRFTFFPFSKVNGVIQPLVLDVNKAFPFRINILPFVYLFDYPTLSEALLNLIGNTTMFIPLGIVWPIVWNKLDTHTKVIGAGIGFSLCIELLQLPFFDRVTDVDDLILNSSGFIIGYLLYLIVRFFIKKVKSRNNNIDKIKCDG